MSSWALVWNYVGGCDYVCLSPHTLGIGMLIRRSWNVIDGASLPYMGTVKTVHFQVHPAHLLSSLLAF